MNKAKSVNGSDLMLWIGTKVIALSKSCKLNLTAATVDSETKDDGDWDAKEIGTRGWTLSNESVYSADKNRSIDLVYSDLYKLYVSNDPVDITVGVPSNNSTTGVTEEGWKAPTSDYMKGKAVITGLDLDGTKGNKGSVTISLEGFGALQYVESQATE